MAPHGTRSLILVALLAACSPSGAAPEPSPAPSPYAGQQLRSIKSLSAPDIAELRAGEGWGFAKPAELNGVPGPRHVLDLADELGLSAAQRRQVQAVFEGMRARARELGAAFVDAEARLSRAFAARAPSKASVRAAVAASARAREQLRLVHLEAHVETAGILRAEQRAAYVELRGYSSDDPCARVPAGHDAEMWRRHHGCR